VNVAAVYRLHPDVRDADFPVWWCDPDIDYGLATLEGGAVTPVGAGVVLVGMCERTTPQAVGQLARALFAQGAAERVIACKLPIERASMHLDTIFTFCDRDLVTLFPDVVDGITAYSLRPGEQDWQIDVREEAAILPRWSPRLLACRSCASSRPAVMLISPSASSGTTATMSSRSSRGWSLPMTATHTPTRCFAR